LLTSDILIKEILLFLVSFDGAETMYRGCNMTEYRRVGHILYSKIEKMHISNNCITMILQYT